MNRETLIELIQEARQTLEKLLTLLQSAPPERDRFVSHLFSLEGSFGGRAKLPGSPASKSSDASSRRFRVAESMGFKGDIRQWEHLLRIGD